MDYQVHDERDLYVERIMWRWRASWAARLLREADHVAYDDDLVVESAHTSPIYLHWGYERENLGPSPRDNFVGIFGGTWVKRLTGWEWWADQPREGDNG